MMTGVLQTKGGRVVDRDGAVLLGRGGEARVWGLPACGHALKILEPHARNAARTRALEHLVSSEPPRMISARDETPWGWPVELVYEGDACVGYTMRWFRKRKTLFSLLCPTERMRVFPAFDHRYLHRLGANLASALDCMHHAGIVVGDLSEANVLVASDATVAFIDVDSFQLIDANGELLPCPVGKPELLPPEHHGELFSATPKTPASDAFSLAVLLFQLLFDGPHPFSGVHKQSGAAPTISEAILAGDYVFAEKSRLSPRLGMPTLSLLHPALRTAFERTFIDGLKRPELRTTAREWAALLTMAEGELVRCKTVPAHLHSRHSLACPWCERRASFGRAWETFVESVDAPSDQAPLTQRPLPRVSNDETPAPAAAELLEVLAEVGLQATGPTLAPLLLPPASTSSPAEPQTPPNDVRLAEIPRRSRFPQSSSARRPVQRTRATTPLPVAPEAAPMNAATAPIAAEPMPPVPEEPITERTTLPPSSPFIDALIRSERIAPAPAPTWESQTRKLGPWAIGVAVLFVFLLGRWSAPSPEPQPAAREVTSSSAHASVRGSAVLRRESGTTDTRSPRPPR
jgi:serine/threonine protein kinase